MPLNILFKNSISGHALRHYGEKYYVFTIFYPHLTIQTGCKWCCHTQTKIVWATICPKRKSVFEAMVREGLKKKICHKWKVGLRRHISAARRVSSFGKPRSFIFVHSSTKFGQIEKNMALMKKWSFRDVHMNQRDYLVEKKWAQIYVMNFQKYPKGLDLLNIFGTVNPPLFHRQMIPLGHMNNEHPCSTVIS